MNSHCIVDYLRNIGVIKTDLVNKDKYIIFSSHSTKIDDDDIINCDEITHTLFDNNDCTETIFNANLDSIHFVHKIASIFISEDNSFRSRFEFHSDSNVEIILDGYYKSIEDYLYITFKTNNNFDLTLIPNQVTSFILDDVKKFNRKFSKIIFTGLDFEGDISQKISELYTDSVYVKFSSELFHNKVCAILSDACYHIMKYINGKPTYFPVEINSCKNHLCREEKINQEDVGSLTFSSYFKFNKFKQYDEILYYYDQNDESLYIAFAGTDDNCNNRNPSKIIELFNEFLSYIAKKEDYFNELWNHVKENLNEFIFGNNQINKDNMKIFFTGHSRGGFIANKLFQKFIECYSFPFVYLRTFGIPASFNNSIQNRDEINNGLMNVVSYCNSNDKVIESLIDYIQQMHKKMMDGNIPREFVSRPGKDIKIL